MKFSSNCESSLVEETLDPSFAIFLVLNFVLKVDVLLVCTCFKLIFQNLIFTLFFQFIFHTLVHVFLIKCYKRRGGGGGGGKIFFKKKKINKF
jgi:hypothetical protein